MKNQKVQRFFELLRLEVISDSKLVKKPKKLKKIFKLAVTSLKEGKLKSDIENNFEDYFNEFLRVATAAVKTKEGEDVPIDAHTTPADHRPLAYNMYTKGDTQLALPTLPEEDATIYRAFLEVSFMELDEDDLIDLAEKCQDPPCKDERGVWRTLASCLHGDPCRLQKAMQICNKLYAQAVEDSIASNKKKSLKKSCQFGEAMLKFFHQQKYVSDFDEKPCFEDLLAGIIATYMDSFVALSHCDQEEDTASRNKILYSFILRLLGNRCTYFYDALLQMEELDQQSTEGDANIILPILRHVIQTTNNSTSPKLYTKFALAARMSLKLWPNESSDLRLSVQQVPAPEGFCSWIQERSPDILENAPVTKRFRGVQITRWLTADIEQSTVEALLDMLMDVEEKSVCEPPSMVNGDTSARESEEMETGYTFVIDKNPTLETANQFKDVISEPVTDDELEDSDKECLYIDLDELEAEQGNIDIGGAEPEIIYEVYTKDESKKMDIMQRTEKVLQAIAADPEVLDTSKTDAVYLLDSEAVNLEDSEAVNLVDSESVKLADSEEVDHTEAETVDPVVSESDKAGESDVDEDLEHVSGSPQKKDKKEMDENNTLHISSKKAGEDASSPRMEVDFSSGEQDSSTDGEFHFKMVETLFKGKASDQIVPQDDSPCYFLDRKKGGDTEISTASPRKEGQGASNISMSPKILRTPKVSQSATLNVSQVEQSEKNILLTPPRSPSSPRKSPRKSKQDDIPPVTATASIKQKQIRMNEGEESPDRKTRSTESHKNLSPSAKRSSRTESTSPSGRRSSSAGSENTSQHGRSFSVGIDSTSPSGMRRSADEHESTLNSPSSSKRRRVKMERETNKPSPRTMCLRSKAVVELKLLPDADEFTKIKTMPVSVAQQAASVYSFTSDSEVEGIGRSSLHGRASRRKTTAGSEISAELSKLAGGDDKTPAQSVFPGAAMKGKTYSSRRRSMPAKKNKTGGGSIGADIGDITTLLESPRRSRRISEMSTDTVDGPLTRARKRHDSEISLSSVDNLPVSVRACPNVIGSSLPVPGSPRRSRRISEISASNIDSPLAKTRKREGL